MGSVLGFLLATRTQEQVGILDFRNFVAVGSDVPVIEGHLSTVDLLLGWESFVEGSKRLKIDCIPCFVIPCMLRLNVHSQVVAVDVVANRCLYLAH